MDKEFFIKEYTDAVVETYGKSVDKCTKHELYEALVHFVHTLGSEARNAAHEKRGDHHPKKVYYFSMEFLIGRLLENYLINFGIRETVSEGFKDLGIDLNDVLEAEVDPGLGNGGLGRLAACFMDSMASTGVTGIGMGLRYRFGLFRQRIESGYQIEEPDAWLENGYPWEFPRPDNAVFVRFGGRVDRTYKDGKVYFNHVDYDEIKAVPYDIPILGYGADQVNTLHLWSAEPVHDSVNMAAFNAGDYALAMKEKSEVEAITCILYPDDSNGIGKKLRLRQEYFLVAAGIGAIIRSYKHKYGLNKLHELPEHVAIHINDTHPTMCIPELMRVLIDEEGMEWDNAWSITTRTISFTNHTVLPEALEKWGIEPMRQLLPRLYMIIEEIDRRYRDEINARYPGNGELLRKTAVLWDGEVRMANLSIIGSYSVNGVAALHTDILKESVFKEFYTIWPDKFNNKTNGISQRRFLIQSNPSLAQLITESIGEAWLKDMSHIKEIEKFKDDSAFLERLQNIKKGNKHRLADYIYRTQSILVDPDSIFDIQVKRIHAYKRQLLNAFKVLDLYHTLKANPDYPINNYTFVFSGKAAQGYAEAKEIIKFICSVADLVNSDPVVSKRIKVIFIENFCVSNAQLIYPAADISEQISTAGKEASGTGNMKFMMNGAITLGTLDGANVEIRDQVGDDNICIFGLKAEETMNFYKNGGYSSTSEIQSDPRLKLLTDELVDGYFKGSGQDFWLIHDSLVQRNDEFFVLKDFDAYVDAWESLGRIYNDKERWSRMSLANIAASSYFSSDRTIAEYAHEIWHAECNL